MEKHTKEYYENLTRYELRRLAAIMNLRGVSQLKKEELIKVLFAFENYNVKPKASNRGRPLKVFNSDDFAPNGTDTLKTAPLKNCHDENLNDDLDDKEKMKLIEAYKLFKKFIKDLNKMLN